MEHPWYIEWFRTPVRLWSVAHGPAVLNVWLTAGLVAMGRWRYLMAGVASHLLLSWYTARVRRLYGVREPTRRDLEILAARGDMAAIEALDRRRGQPT